MKQEAARSGERGNGKLRVSNLSFCEIPHQSKLFLEYLRDPLSLKRYYPNACAAPSDITEFIPTVLAKYETDRDALCGALSEINLQIGAGAKSESNIGLLRRPDTVAVVTGQQAGLFTGPLYTIYKALSAVKMAEYLNSIGSPAVPVFWAATEDHDFTEVAKTSFIGRRGELTQSRYAPRTPLDDFPIGNIHLDSSIGAVIRKTFCDIPHTEFSADLQTIIEKAWAEGNGFGPAFEQELAGMLSKFGLIFLDPLNKKLKKLAAPIYIRAIERADEIVSAIRVKTDQLVGEGYHGQVVVDEQYFPLFWHSVEGRRVSIRRTSSKTYRVKGEKKEFTREDLVDAVEVEPHLFSPGVMLRPVVQDYFLPTVCYIGGAAEIAYFAQNEPVYSILDRPVTPIFHRQSLTIVERQQNRTLRKFGLDLSDLFVGREPTMKAIGRELLANTSPDIFSDTENVIDAELDRLKIHLAGVDITLVAALAKRREKIIYHIEALKTKAYLAHLRNDKAAERQIRSVLSTLLPNGELQERVLNVNGFLNKYGPYFIDWIYETIDLNQKDHEIVYL